MAGTTYDVVVSLSTTGSLEASLGGATSKLGGLESAAGRAQGALAKIGSGFAESFTGAVERGIGALSKLATVGAAGVFAGALYGVKGLNQELETAQTSIAAVLNAQGVTDTIGAGFERAGGLIKQMKVDARDLPGEFSDLFGIFQTGIGGALNAGLTDQSFEKLAAKAMAAGKSLAVPLDQAGRELAQLLDGRAGAHNVFGTRLGIRAEGFNDKSGEDRVKIIEEKLGKFGPAIEQFGKTMDAQWSTAIDNGKAFVGLATQPLFEVAKDALVEINDWFSKNEETVKNYAGKVGRGLRDAFLWGKEVVVEYGPLLWNFAEKTMTRLERGWQTVEPYFSKAASVFGGMLKDADGTLDKVEKILGMYVGLKVLGGAGSIAGLLGGGGSGGAGGVAGLKGAAGLGALGGLGGYGLGTLLGGLVSSGDGLRGDTSQLLPGEVAKALKEQDEAAASIFGKIFAGWGAGTMAGASVGGLPGAVVGGAVGVASGAYGAATDVEQGRLAGTVSAFSKEIDAMATMGGEFNYVAGEFVKGTGEINLASYDFQFRLMQITEQFGELDAELFSFAATVRNSEADFKKRADEEALEIGKGALASLTLATTATATATKATDDTKKDDKKPSLGGGMVIGSVHITVTSNAEAGQIVRKSLDELSKIRRIPTSSSDIRNFSAR